MPKYYMDKLKQEYNKTLQRYYNGCNYIKEHLDEADKYLPIVLTLLNNINEILNRIPNKTKEEIMNGFRT